MERTCSTTRGPQTPHGTVAATGLIAHAAVAWSRRVGGRAGRPLGTACVSVLVLVALAAGAHALERCPNGKYCPDGYVCCFIGGEYLC